ncbi:MAG: helix-turn-helix domain-containing protein, partial [Clostridia bacterium]|nr:helix-turn-helix domain-containing protein [Clostridia bacterium]
MEKIGTILRNARLDKGISLREVEEATKIRLRYLEALENGEFEQLPGRVYALGFLRSYARFLGLDVKELTERFKAEFPAEEEPYIVEDYSISKPGTERKKFPILLLIGVILFLWGVNFLYKTYQPPVEQP